MLGIGKIIGLVVLLVALSGLGIGGFQINQSITAISNCGESCLDIEQAVVGFEFKQSVIPQQLTIVLLFTVRNPSSFTAYVVDLPYKVELAGTQIGQGTLCCLPLVLPGNSKTEAAGIIHLPFSTLPGLAVNAIKEYLKGGIGGLDAALKYKISGSVTFRPVFFGIIIPYSVTRSFEKQGNVL